MKPEKALENQSMTDEQREAIKIKNERRKESISGFREEIKNEYKDSLNQPIEAPEPLILRGLWGFYIYHMVLKSY